MAPTQLDQGNLRLMNDRSRPIWIAILVAGLLLSSCGLSPEYRDAREHQRNADDIRACLDQNQPLDRLQACQKQRQERRIAVSAANGAVLRSAGAALLNPSGSGAPPAQSQICFRQSEFVSGFNRICSYRCGLSTKAITVPSTQLCPMNG